MYGEMRELHAKIAHARWNGADLGAMLADEEQQQQQEEQEQEVRAAAAVAGKGRGAVSQNG
jgi:hypothetical protein